MSTMACYSGPAGTEGNAPCKGGTATCNAAGNGYGDCVGEVTPQPASCASTSDVACLGHENCVQWAEGVGTTVGDVSVDAAGNVYATGSFSQTIQFPNVKLTSTTGRAIYVIMFDPQGRAVWGRSFESADGNGIFANAVAVDKTGNVVIGGTLGGPGQAANFDGQTAGPGSFVVKLDGTTHNVLWAQSVNANVQDIGDQINGLAFDSSGDVLVGGRFFWGLALGDIPTPRPMNFMTAGFIAKLSGADGSSTTANGGWVRVLCDNPAGSTQMCQVTGVRVNPNDEVVISGYFQGSVSFGGVVAASGKQDAFVAKLASKDAGLTWLKQIGGSGGTVSAYKVAADANGGAIVVGDFQGTVAPAPGITMTASPENAFVVRYGANGSYVWNQVLSCGFRNTTANCWLDGVAADAPGNVILVGSFDDSFALPGSNTPLMAFSMQEGTFVAKYSSANSPGLLWAKSFGPTTSNPPFYAGPVAFDYPAAGVGITPSGSSIVFGVASAPLMLGWVSMGASPFVAELSP